MSSLRIEQSPTRSSDSSSVHSTEDEETFRPSAKPPTDESNEEDNLYFMQSTFVFIQVEKRLFRVPTYRFANDSQAFTKLFKLPAPDACDTKGSSRENAIVLLDISWRDFQNFLKALYPLTVSINLKLSKPEWISVLRLSTLWYFLKYRQMAISSLKDGNELSPTDKIVYGREFRIRDWIEEGCRELVSKDKTINREEATIVGFETTVSLFRIREDRIKRNSDAGVMMGIREGFKDELDLVELSELQYRANEDEGVVQVTPNTSSGPFVFQSASDFISAFTPSVNVAVSTKKKSKHRTVW